MPIRRARLSPRRLNELYGVSPGAAQATEKAQTPGASRDDRGDQPARNQEGLVGNPGRVLELIEEVIGMVRQHRQQPQPQLLPAGPSDQRRSITEFRKLAPPTFKGSSNPHEAEAWIDEMEKAFRAMDCTEEEKIRFATYMLQDRAHHWWTSVERTLTRGPELVTWQKFRTAFYSKYFPSSRLRELEREFLNLSQGNKTVDEYEAEFDRLSRFAPTLVLDPDSRIRRFEEGLRPYLRRGLAAVHSVDYDDLVDRAKNMEIIWKET